MNAAPWHGSSHERRGNACVTDRQALDYFGLSSLQRREAQPVSDKYRRWLSLGGLKVRHLAADLVADQAGDDGAVAVFGVGLVAEQGGGPPGGDLGGFGELQLGAGLLKV